MQVSSRSSWSEFSLLSLGVFVVSALAALVAFVPAAGASPDADSYIVVLKDDVAHPANVAHRHEDNRGAEVGHIYGAAIEGYSAELTASELKAIRQDPNVDYVAPGGEMHLDSQMMSSAFKRVFANTNPNLDIDEIDDVRTNVDVAILDSGVEAKGITHPDLNVVARTNCQVEGAGCKDGIGFDVFGHGTHVAGIVGALDNNFGTVGTAPGARIWSVKVLQDDGLIEEDLADDPENGLANVIAGVNWVTERSSQIEVVNMSLSCVQTSECATGKPLREAIAAAVDKGIVFVVSAGNNNSDVSGEPAEAISPTFPASFPDVITVSALEDSDGIPGGLGPSPSSPSCRFGNAQITKNGGEIYFGQDDTLANFSNWGAAVDIAAPGTCITSTAAGGGYKQMSGTSQASPLVAGAVAGLAAAKNPNNRSEVEAIRNFVRSLGNYNWTDTHQLSQPGLTLDQLPLGPDGIQEPLLDMRIAGATKDPTTSTSPATEVTKSSARLNGSVNPNGAATTYYIQYGETTSYGATIHTPPGSPIGNGTAPIAVWNVLSGLEAETTYHYRVVATNASGTSYGQDQAFTTGPATWGSPSVLLDQADDQTWVHSRNFSTGALEYSNWKGSTGWIGPEKFATTMRGGSNPAAVLDKATKQQWLYYVEPGGTLKYWNWKAGGVWSEQTLPGPAIVKPNTSPAVAFDQSTKQQWVYYVGTDNQLKLWNWTLANGWVFYNLGSSIAPGTSPTVSYDEATQETSVYYVRSADMQIGQFRWTGATGWQQATLGGSVRARTSPTVVLHQGSKQQWVYFVASDGALKYFNYNPSGGWKLFALSAEVAPNTSPTAIIDPATYQQWVYYADPAGNIDYWNWTGANGWLPYSLSASVAPGTSVAVALDLTSKQQWVYYRNSGGSIFYWNWNGAAGGWKHFP
jgi:subtilisin family serine protease